MDFPVIETTVAAVHIPAVPAVPELNAGNVRFSPVTACWFRPIWTDGKLSGVEGEWYWEVGTWDETQTIWTSAKAEPVRHYEPNLLDPEFAQANPEVAAMGAAFAAMAAISKRKGVI